MSDFIVKKVTILQKQHLICLINVNHTILWHLPGTLSRIPVPGILLPYNGCDDFVAVPDPAKIKGRFQN
jgi:hypothetical protein